METDKEKSEQVKGPKTRDVGKAEPGWDRFERYYRANGARDVSIVQYAEWLGKIRGLSDRPLLELDADGLEALDAKLSGKARVYRAILKMFLKANKKKALADEALRPLKKQTKRKLGMEDVLTPDDVMALLAQTSNLRDRGLIATLASTGGRVNEVLGLRLKDVKASNGSAYQCWFGATKVRGQERYSCKIEGVWKTHVDAWLKAHPQRGDKEAWVFPSTSEDGGHVSDSTVRELLRSLAKRAGVKKAVNPHSFRSARVTWGILNKEDMATLCIGIWGQPFTPMLNDYNRFRGLDTGMGEPRERVMPEVPALPTPPILSTQRQVAELTARIEQMERDRERLANEAVKASMEGLLGEIRSAMKTAGHEVLDRDLTEQEMAAGSKAIGLWVSKKKS